MKIKHTDSRDSSIELYRVMLMFGIGFLHSITFGPCNRPWVANIFSSCVVGFVFISGWFGINFSWKKLAKLYGIGLYAAGMHSLFAGWELFLPTFKCFWFLHAYAFMMCLAPFVNVSRGGMCMLPLLAMVWIWGFGLTLPIVGKCLPFTDGLHAYGGTTLLAVYVAARWVRVSGITEKIKICHLAIAIPLLCFVTGIGLGDYNSPFAFALAGCVFIVVKRIKIRSGILEWVAMTLGPSMFSVYLLNANRANTEFIRTFEPFLVENGVPALAVCLFTATAVFVGGIILDLPRRWTLMCLSLHKCERRA